MEYLFCDKIDCERGIYICAEPYSIMWSVYWQGLPLSIAATRTWSREPITLWLLSTFFSLRVTLHGQTLNQSLKITEYLIFVISSADKMFSSICLHIKCTICWQNCKHFPPKTHTVFHEVWEYCTALFLTSSSMRGFQVYSWNDENWAKENFESIFLVKLGPA